MANLSDAQAKLILYQAWQSLFPGVEPAVGEIAMAQAVARGETAYGRSWKGAGVGSLNWGAIQAGKPPCNPDRSFIYTDRHEDGTKYEICFAKYPDDVSAAAALLKILYVQMDLSALAQAGDSDAFVAGMRAKGYFELGLGEYQEAVRTNLTALLPRAYGFDYAALPANAALPLDAAPVAGDTPIEASSSDGAAGALLILALGLGVGAVALRRRGRR